MQNQISLCSLNVCGLNSKFNIGNLNEYVKLFDIFCVSETKVKNGVDIDNFTVFNLENRTQNYPLPGIHGLNVYISNHIANLCVQISDNNLYCNLVIWIKVADSFILGALYLPYEGSKYYQNDIYDDLSLDICNIKSKYDMPLLLTGDFNSRTGLLNEIMILEVQDDILDTSHFNYPNIIEIFKSLKVPLNRANKDTKTNNNGRKLVEMCKLHELCFMNGRIGSDKNIGDFTCAGASTVDYMICTPDLLQNIQDYTVDIFDSMLSDKHSPINVSINLDPDTLNISNSNVTTVNHTKESITKCKWNDEKKVEFQMSFDESKINDIFLTLSSINETEISQENMDLISNDLKDIFMEPAKTTGMCKEHKVAKQKRKGKSNKPWFNNICKTSDDRYKKFKKSLRKHPNTTEKDTLFTMAKTHKKLLRKEKRKFEKELNAKIRNLKSTDPGKYWSIINPRRKGTKIGDISLSAAWTHFSELNKDNSDRREDVTGNFITNETINEPFTIDEIRKHITFLKKDKSPGIDFILNEFIKNCPDKLIHVIVLLFNLVLESGFIPTDWTIGIIKVLYKNKGDINDVNNYRGITLLSCLGKLFTSVINNRLYNYLTTENIIGSEQVGFRPKHSTLDHIFALHILSNYYIQEKKQLFCAFVDYSKAFDFVDRTYLWQKLLNSNVNGKVLNVVKNMYKNAKSHVSVNNILSDSFPCQVGVRQGENLSPLLFAIYLNDFKTFLSEKYIGLTRISESISNELNLYLKIFCLLYADDTLVLAESAAQLQKALNGLNMYCNKWALKVNLDKTKVIIFSRGKIRKYKSFKFGDNSVDVVEDYVYLGTTFNYNGTFHKAKAKQVLQAKKANFSLITKVRQLNLSADTFTELFERLIIPILLYGSEIWGYENPRQLQIMCNNVMRKFLRLHKSTSTCMLTGELGMKEVAEYIDNRMLNFWYNVATGDESKISTILYKWIKVLYDRNTFKSPWLDKVKTSLDVIGMPNLFNNMSNVKKIWFKNTIKLRLNAIYSLKWSASVFNNSTCLNYRAMTESKHMHNYLLNLPSQYMYAFCKFKCANHRMPIVSGRYANIAVDHRKCDLCDLNEIGDEFHYLFNCPFFREDRVRYIKRFFYISPNMYKMTQLFNYVSNKEMFNLAKFIYIIITHFRNR